MNATNKGSIFIFNTIQCEVRTKAYEKYTCNSNNKTIITREIIIRNKSLKHYNHIKNNYEIY